MEAELHELTRNSSLSARVQVAIAAQGFAVPEHRADGRMLDAAAGAILLANPGWRSAAEFSMTWDRTACRQGSDHAEPNGGPLRSRAER